ncbi:segmentation protein cap n collar-like protein [Lasius niger]|uniref:Segmentation protein cap n collar-like protein n=1 Tax=Lasius niger TaxID=67767 RepID=A0A0J7L8Q5_LASNI|nr:segmentation protein cap n collar-like protein [Lasius niger]
MDMDLIEVLWKQDVDLGFTLVEPATTPAKKSSTSEKESADDIEKLKALEAINATNQKNICQHVVLFENDIDVTRKELGK